MLTLGADPDLHQAAYVLLDEHDVIHAYGCTKVHRRFTGPSAVGRVIAQLGALALRTVRPWPNNTEDVGVVMVEGQEFYFGTNEALQWHTKDQMKASIKVRDVTEAEVDTITQALGMHGKKYGLFPISTDYLQEIVEDLKAEASLEEA